MRSDISVATPPSALNVNVSKKETEKQGFMIEVKPNLLQHCPHFCGDLPSCCNVWPKLFCDLMGAPKLLIPADPLQGFLCGTASLTPFA
jgi:hypothetical protein